MQDSRCNSKLIFKFSCKFVDSETGYLFGKLLILYVMRILLLKMQKLKKGICLRWNRWTLPKFQRAEQSNGSRSTLMIPLSKMNLRILNVKLTSYFNRNWASNTLPLAFRNRLLNIETECQWDRLLWKKSSKKGWKIFSLYLQERRKTLWL